MIVGYFGQDRVKLVTHADIHATVAVFNVNLSKPALNLLFDVTRVPVYFLGGQTMSKGQINMSLGNCPIVPADKS